MGSVGVFSLALRWPVSEAVVVTEKKKHCSSVLGILGKTGRDLIPEENVKTSETW